MGDTTPLVPVGGYINKKKKEQPPEGPLSLFFVVGELEIIPVDILDLIEARDIPRPDLGSVAPGSTEDASHGQFCVAVEGFNVVEIFVHVHSPFTLVLFAAGRRL